MVLFIFLKKKSQIIRSNSKFTLRQKSRFGFGNLFAVKKSEKKRKEEEREDLKKRGKEG